MNNKEFVPPDAHLKPYRVYYEVQKINEGKADEELNTVVYAADEEHARDIAPQLFFGLFHMLKIKKVEHIKGF